MWRRLVVVSDRYHWDTLVDFILNFPEELVSGWLLWKLLIKIAPVPDYAFLILVPVEESIRCSDLKGEPFRDPPDTGAPVKFYQNLTYSGSVQVLDGCQSINDLADTIHYALKY